MRIPLAYKLSLPLLIALIIFVGAVGLYMRSSLRDALFLEEYIRVHERVQKNASSYITGYDLIVPTDPVAIAHFTAFWGEMRDPTVARITIWDERNCIVYSDLHGLAGQCAPNFALLKTAQVSTESFYERRRSALEDEIEQTAVDDFLDIFVPVQHAGGRSVVEVRLVAAALTHPIDEAVRNIFIIFVVSGVAMFVLSYIVTHMLVLRPLKRLRTGAEAIGDGDLMHHIDLKTGDEFEVLASSFDQMANNISALDRERARLIRDSKREFVNMVIHQLRTPLTGARWALDALIKDGIGDEKQRGYVRQSASAVELVLELVNDLLVVTQIEEGKFVYSFKTVALAPLLGDVVKSFHGRATAKDVRLDFARPPELPSVRGDAEKLQMLFTTILQNALQYTPSGGTVAVDAKVEGGSIIVSVADTGIGVPEAEQSHVFEKFYRGTNTALINEGGNGLGLYIAHAIARAHDGTIWFKSGAQGGTTFYVKLPPAPAL